MASFQAKIGWKSPRKKENKNYRFNQFLPDLLKGIPKNKKTPLWLLSGQNRLEKLKK